MPLAKRKPLLCYMRQPVSLRQGPYRWVLLTLLVVGSVLFSIGKDDWHRSLNRPSADGAYYYAYLPTIFLDHDLDFDNQYSVTKNWYQLGKTPIGRTANVFGAGPAFFEAPFFLLGHGIACMAGLRTDGFSAVETWLVLWSSWLFTLGALFFSVKIASRRVVQGWPSYVGPLLAMLAGPVCYYGLRQPGYAHPVAAFTAAFFIERWDATFSNAARSRNMWLVLGASFGAAVLARPQLALWGLLLPIAMADDMRNRGSLTLSQLIRRWLLGGLAALVVFSPQLVVWKLLYGAWYTVPQGSGFMRWDDIAWTETLFSSRNGLFAWAPLYAPMLLGFLFMRPRGRLVLPLLCGLVLQALANGAVWDWWGGGSFGGRRFDSTFIIFALGATVLLSHAQRILAATWHRRTPLQLAMGLSVSSLIGLGANALVAQLIVVGHTSVVSARTQGGESAAKIFVEKAGFAGIINGGLSNIATFPARLFFSYRNDVDLSAYDKLVGVHYLGETFPGLNPTPDKLREDIAPAKLQPPRAFGLMVDANGNTVTTADEVRIFVGLNRRDDVVATMTVAAQGNIELRWDNGAAVLKSGAGLEELSVRLAAPKRGVHWLRLRAPHGTLVHTIALRAE